MSKPVYAICKQQYRSASKSAQSINTFVIHCLDSTIPTAAISLNIFPSHLGLTLEFVVGNQNGAQGHTLLDWPLSVTCDPRADSSSGEDFD